MAWETWKGQYDRELDLLVSKDREAAAKVGDAMQARVKARTQEFKKLAENGMPVPDSNVRMGQYVMHSLFSRLQETNPDAFIVKGGTLMFMAGDEFRPTMDVDFSLDGMPASEAEFKAQVMTAFAEAFGHDSEDGVWIDPESIRFNTIREGFVPGVRVAAEVWVGKARVDLKCDVCHGDHVYPTPVRIKVEPFLPKHQQAVEIPGYTWQTVVAEKLHGMAEFGKDTTRLKDFYDIAVIARTHDMDGEMLAGAIAATFLTRDNTTVLAPEDMAALSSEFVARNERQFAGWMAKNALQHRDLTLAECVDTIHRYAGPALRSVIESAPLDLTWLASEGGWVEHGMEIEDAMPDPEDFLPEPAMVSKLSMW